MDLSKQPEQLDEPYTPMWRARLLARGMMNDTGFHIPTHLDSAVRAAWGIRPRNIVEYTRPNKKRK